MLVFFLVFGQIFTFLVAEYLVSILHIFLAYLKACYPYILKRFHALIKLRVSISPRFFK